DGIRSRNVTGVQTCALPISTGAQNDLERISNMAFAMVAEYGMSEELGYLSLKNSNNPENSYGFNKKYSEQTAERIDEAVKEIIRHNYERTKALINKYKDQLEDMGETLLDKEAIDHNDLKDLLGDHPEGKYPEGIFDSEKETGSTSNGYNKTAVDAEIIEEEPLDGSEKGPDDQQE